MSRAASVNRAFLYVASKPGGGRDIAVRNARSERALAEMLRRDRLVLLRAWGMPGWLSTEAELTLKDQAALNEQLGQLLSRGVPLVEALEVAASVVRGKVKPRIDRMREMVAAGSGFADAAKAAGGVDRVTTAVYRAAERTGDLAGASTQIAKTARRRLEIASKATTLMIYPAMVSVIGISAGLFLLAVIVPKIAESLRQAGGDIPWVTEIVVSAGEFLQTQWAPLAIGAMLAVVLGVLLRKPIGMVIGRVGRVTPVLKDVLLLQETSRFFTVMAAMTRSGVPLADALGVAAGAIGHPTLRKQLDRLRVRLVQGGVLSRLIDEVEAMPLATRRLLIAADRAGDMESAFDSLSEDTAKALETSTTRLLALLEPILIVLLFAFIGSILLAVVIPMVTITANQI